jgi:hypothetical protein
VAHEELCVFKVWPSDPFMASTGVLPSIDLFVLDTTNDPVTLTLCVEN